jgi:hypothetical protein
MFVVSCGKLPGGYDPSISFGGCLLRDEVEGTGDPARAVDVKKLPLITLTLLFPDVRLNFDKVRVGFALIVEAMSDIDLFGGFGMGGSAVGYGSLPRLIGVFGPIVCANTASASFVVDLGRAIFILIPVGSSRPCRPLS